MAKSGLIFFYRKLLFILTVLLTATPVTAGEPLNVVKQGIEEIRAVFRNDDLLKPANKAKRNDILRSIVEKRFDFEEMAQRSLGPYWKERTPEEKEEFVRLYTRLLEDTYLRLVEKYEDEIRQHREDRVIYLDEKIEDSYAMVKTEIHTKTETEVPVNYRLLQKDGVWKIYDVIATGVGLISNYRGQFRDIMGSGTYQDLVKRLKEKTVKGETEWPGKETDR